MSKKTTFVALASFMLGAIIYTVFLGNKPTDNGIISEGNKSEEVNNQAVSSTTEKEVSVVKKRNTYSIKIDKDRGVVISLNGKEFGIVPVAAIGTVGARFNSVTPTDKTGEYVLVSVENPDKSIDFGLISSERIAYKSLTKQSGIKNVQPGIVLSPNKKFAVFQYLNDGGVCKKDLLLGVLDINSEKIIYPTISHDYIAGTGIWQIDTGSYRFISDSVLQFLDMPRACDGSGKYDMQKYYSWNFVTGEITPMSFN